MTTRINITVDQSGLLARAANQTRANHEALAIQQEQKKIEEAAVTKITEKRRSLGQDIKTGKPLAIATPAKAGGYGDINGNNRIGQDPAANRSPGSGFIDISVVDEDGGYFLDDAFSEWLEYRRKYPRNIFVMFRPITPGLPYTEWKEPPGFLSDSNVYIIDVAREPGQSDWYAELRDRRLDRKFKYVHILVDNSGSMTIDTVQSSMNLFAANVNSAGKKFLRRPEPGRDWQDMLPSENWLRQHIDVNRSRPQLA